MVRVFGVGDQLGGLKAGQGLSGAGRVPDIAAEGIRLRPAAQRDAAGNAGNGVILIAAQDLQQSVRIIGHCIETNELMGHGDGEQGLRHILPVVHRFVVDVRPMEVEIPVEAAVRAGVGKVHGLLRGHGDKNLDQGKQAGEDALAGVSFNLMARLADVNAAALEFTVDQGHAVYQKCKITPAVLQHGAFGVEYRLLGNLIAALGRRQSPTGHRSSG